jgi:hypothetical protein
MSLSGYWYDIVERTGVCGGRTFKWTVPWPGREVEGTKGFVKDMVLVVGLSRVVVVHGWSRLN